MKYLNVILILILLCFPLFVAKGITLFIWCSFWGVAFCLINNIKGAPMLLCALLCCIPAGFGEVDIPNVKKLVYIYNVFFQYILPITVFIITIRHHNKIPTIGVLVYGVLSLLIATFYSFMYNERYDFFNMLGLVSVCTCSIYIYWFNKIDLKSFFKLFDIIFAAVFIYTLLDIIHNTPYQPLYSRAETQNIQYALSFSFRNKALFGHPLFLAGFALFYQVSMLIRYELYKEFSWYKEIACLVCIILTVSRTPIVVLIAIFLIYILVYEKFKSFSKMSGIIISATFISIIALIFGNKYVNLIFDRFSSDNINHRYGAYETCMKVLDKFPLGVGKGNLYDIIERFHLGGDGYSESFKTMDNIYLTMLSSYSAFSIIVLGFLFYPLYFILAKQSNIDKKRSVILVYSVAILLGLSFNWDGSYIICYLLFGLSALILKEKYH